MGEIFKPGVKLSSTVCKTQIMALRVPPTELEITCGGAPMQVGEPAELGTPSGDNNGTLVGKRYTDEEETMEFPDSPNLLKDRSRNLQRHAFANPSRIIRRKSLPVSL